MNIENIIIEVVFICSHSKYLKYRTWLYHLPLLLNGSELELWINSKKKTFMFSHISYYVYSHGNSWRIQVFHIDEFNCCFKLVKSSKTQKTLLNLTSPRKKKLNLFNLKNPMSTI